MIPGPAAKVPLETDALVTAMFGVGIVLVPAFAVVGRSSVTIGVMTLYVLFEPAYLVAKSIWTEKEGEESQSDEETKTESESADENDEAS